MLIFVSLLLSLVLASLSMAVPWRANQIKTWQVAVGFAVGFVLWILGAALSLGWYPWTNIIDFLVAVGAGMLVGRAIPAKFWPFFIFLLVLSALDTLQIVLSHPSAPAAPSATVPAGQLYPNFLLQLPWGRYGIGIFDLFVFAAIATYWRRRAGDFLVGYAGVALGLIIAYMIIFVAGSRIVLPLIPFLTLGWLCSGAISRYRKQPEPEGKKSLEGA